MLYYFVFSLIADAFFDAVLVPSLFDMCLAVIGEEYATKMNEQQRAELDNALPAPILTSLMMETAAHLAITLPVKQIFDVVAQLVGHNRHLM